jgi:uncharacterized surface protein with fasciclin (FAS1) repeats
MYHSSGTVVQKLNKLKLKSKEQSMKSLFMAFSLLFSTHFALASDERLETDIVDTAVAAGSFKTLVGAVSAADLVETLKIRGPMTVFAPVDAAFDKLPEGSVDYLLGNIPALTKLLTYHVVFIRNMRCRTCRSFYAI